jgi:hypothetical protein
MKNIEDMIGDGPDAREFWDDCMAAFGDPKGQRLLRRLCSFIHPLGSPLRGTPEETHVCIGRQEIVAALWRRSQPTIQPSDAPPHPT